MGLCNFVMRILPYFAHTQPSFPIYKSFLKQIIILILTYFFYLRLKFPLKQMPPTLPIILEGLIISYTINCMLHCFKINPPLCYVIHFVILTLIILLVIYLLLVMLVL